MRAAEEHGRKLTKFSSPEEATATLFGFRDDRLAYLQRHYPGNLEFSGKDLKAVEAWYFSHFASGAERSGELSRETVEEALAVYLGEALVRSAAQFRWAVEPFVFAPGTFELAVSRPLHQIGITRAADLYSRQRNSRRDSIYRAFKKYAG
jgi:hypothetical protein